jgi:hypothetical protein
MILSSKQLEELEHLHDSVSEFDDEANVSSDNEEFDEASEGALAWRRGMLERAANMVKKNDRKPLSSKDNYPVGTLVYDTLNNRFARVKESSTSQVLLAYVSGGEGILKGSVIQITQAAKPTAVSKKKPEPKPKAEPKNKPEAKKKPEVQKPVVKKPVAKQPAAKKPAPKKPAPKKVAAKKPAAKKVAPKKKPPTKKPAAKKKAPTKKVVSKKKPVAKKKAPVKKPASKKQADPNTLIKQNYKKLSNKELSKITGLSEHTIRRKLGEWGLKRPVR